MQFWLAGWIRLSLLALSILPVAQSVAAQVTASIPQAPNPRSLELSSIAVPYDPLEIVTSGAQQVQTAEDRAAAMDLLVKARRLSNVRSHAYDLKTSFTSYGSSSSDGRWILEDMSPGANVYRWTAQGPGFSGIFLDANRLLSSNQPGGTMPLRLAQVRDAMWDVYFPAIGPHAILRVANGYLNGAALRCVLVARGFYGNAKPQFSSGRSFDESEYCVNPQTALLEMYSPYGGLYIRFDYANGLHFHEQIIPDGFTISEHGKIVIEDKTESVTDAASQNSNLFEPTGLNPLGVGQVIVGPMRVHGFQASDSVDAGATGQVVVVRGMVSPDGKLSEVGILASTNPSLDDAAVVHANRAHALQDAADSQPGVTPQSREIIFTVQFAPRPPQNLMPQGSGAYEGPLVPQPNSR